MTGVPAPLVEATRRDVGTGRHVVESRHFGHLVLSGPDGRRYVLGDPSHLTFVRSAAKPFQATACLEILDERDAAAAAALTDGELAVAWASHRAEEDHLLAVRGLLARSDTDAAALTCPPAARPDDPSAPARRIQHNCSGKHAMFALTGRALGLDRSALLEPEGRLQQRVLGHLTEALGPTRAVGVDGCGAPAVAVELDRLAAGFGRLVTEERYRRVRAAGLRCPGNVGGTGRLESALLAAGVVAKPGAEAVFVAAWLDADGAAWSLALKIEDGGSRAAPVAAHGLLSEIGVVDRGIWSPDPVLGGGEPQGVIRPAAEVGALAAEVARG